MTQDAVNKPDYKSTIFLPKTEFAMKANLSKVEPEIIQAWDVERSDPQRPRAEESMPPFVLHDGPPYANGHIHIGHALNKILKDMICRFEGKRSRRVDLRPGWDCHGLPIEWQIEEALMAQKQTKHSLSKQEFRQRCRDFAASWVEVQRKEFMRLGVSARWDDPYVTMDPGIESTIATQVFHMRDAGLLYRARKPIMWSVAEATALAEAEIEYLPFDADTIWVGFEVVHGDPACLGAHFLVWTTTPWTLPANRALAFNPSIEYGIYEAYATATASNADTPHRLTDTRHRLIIADSRAQHVADAFAANPQHSHPQNVQTWRLGKRLGDANIKEGMRALHPLARWNDSYDSLNKKSGVPVLSAGFVTQDSGSGIVHIAPSHGPEDYALWVAKSDLLRAWGDDTDVPHTTDDESVLQDICFGFAGRRVMTTWGKKGDANEAVTKALSESGTLFARGTSREPYPHSWRSKKPLIHRATPQWFIAMDKPTDALDGRSLRQVAIEQIDQIIFRPDSAKQRLRNMIAQRPDWVISRQRMWGVPIPLFVHKQTGQVLSDAKVDARISIAFADMTSDAWYQDGFGERVLAPDHDPKDWDMVQDILDVWFESGVSHVYALGQEARPVDVYLEGSDQHRGWFQASLLTSCALTGKAPCREIITHGFVLDEHGNKMSKSLKNVVSPQTVIDTYGADVLRVWVACTQHSDDVRVGTQSLNAAGETYRQLRNTLRYLLGCSTKADDRMIPHVQKRARQLYASTPQALVDWDPLDAWILQSLKERHHAIIDLYKQHNITRAFSLAREFISHEVSAIYLDVRKDRIYCDGMDDERRMDALCIMQVLLDHIVSWLEPICPMTISQVLDQRSKATHAAYIWPHMPGRSAAVHGVMGARNPRMSFLDNPRQAEWENIWVLRRTALQALEDARAKDIIGSSLQAHLIIHTPEPNVYDWVNWSTLCLTSGFTMSPQASNVKDTDANAGGQVVCVRADGVKCPRCWHVRQSDHVDGLCARCHNAIDSMPHPTTQQSATQ